MSSIFLLPLEDWKSILEIVAQLVTIVAGLAAAWWFFFTTKVKPRIQFDINLKLIPVKDNPDFRVAEIQCVFENKGFVEHRLWDLNISVHGLESLTNLQSKEKTKEVVFKKPILEQVCIVPSKYQYYFVRPGVRQVITHITYLPSTEEIVRITAGFNYHKNSDYPHTVRRVFEVTTS